MGDFFRMLDAGKFSDPSDKGVYDKLYMKVKRKFGIMSESDKAEIQKMANAKIISLMSGSKTFQLEAYNFFRGVPLGCLKMEDLYKISKVKSREKVTSFNAMSFLLDILSQGYFSKEHVIELISKIYYSSNDIYIRRRIFNEVLTQRRWAQHERVFDLLSLFLEKRASII